MIERDKMGVSESLAKNLCDGCAKPWHDTMLYMCNACTCSSECSRGCPCKCTITTHETGDDEEEEIGEEDKG